MYCQKCGKELVDGLKSCPFCGEDVDKIIKNRNSFTNKSKNYNGNSVFGRGSCICACVSIFILPAIFGLVAVILGIISMMKDEEKQSPAILGTIIGICSFLYAMVVTGQLQF